MSLPIKNLGLGFWLLGVLLTIRIVFVGCFLFLLSITELPFPIWGESSIGYGFDRTQFPIFYPGNQKGKKLHPPNQGIDSGGGYTKTMGHADLFREPAESSHPRWRRWASASLTKKQLLYCVFLTCWELLGFLLFSRSYLQPPADFVSSPA